jgi:hypothetical protein
MAQEEQVSRFSFRGPQADEKLILVDWKLILADEKPYTHVRDKGTREKKHSIKYSYVLSMKNSHPSSIDDGWLFAIHTLASPGVGFRRCTRA